MDTHMTLYGIQMIDFDRKKGPVHIRQDVESKYMTLCGNIYDFIWNIDDRF